MMKNIRSLLKKGSRIACLALVPCIFSSGNGGGDVLAMPPDRSLSQHFLLPPNVPPFTAEKSSVKILAKLNPEEQTRLTLMLAALPTIKFEDIEKDLKPHMYESKWDSVCPGIKKALAGDLAEQAYLGHLYRDIHPSDPREWSYFSNKAIQWLLFSLRDDGGKGDAEVELASIYDQRNDSNRANFWWHQAASKGSEQAKEYLEG
jgi:hypothetical protein